MNGGPDMDVLVAYCQVYDRYHTSFALHRMGGWDGNFEKAPPSLMEIHDDMTAKFEKLYVEIMHRSRPNYVELAKELADAVNEGRG